MCGCVFYVYTPSYVCRIYYRKNFVFQFFLVHLYRVKSKPTQPKKAILWLNRHIYKRYQK